jgi:hypothetical protein
MLFTTIDSIIEHYSKEKEKRNDPHSDQQADTIDDVNESASDRICS